ncbi:calmodulin-binding-domain-containing protein [Powellomyces hirtus]|nr:calmodulin-binding-domain-containing protein [Powellomyces hirtus]
MTGPHLGPRPAFLLHSPAGRNLPRESVYSLIEAEVTRAAKPARYESMYADMVRGENGGKKSAASMGPAAVPRPDPGQWLKKGERERGWRNVVHVEPNHPDRTILKAPLPTSPGVLPSPTKKDFITTNALDQINSLAKQPKPAPPSYRTKKDYGLVPAYLCPESERGHAAQPNQAMHIQSHLKNTPRRHQIKLRVQEEDNDMYKLPEDERLKILDGLQNQWKRLNGEYQRLSLTVDTVPKIARKVNMEQQLKHLETNIHKFSHPNILVAFGEVYAPPQSIAPALNV